MRGAMLSYGAISISWRTVRASRQLLYVTPVVPDRTGSGLAMRAGAVLDLLADRDDVSLLVAPEHGAANQEIPQPIADRCRRIVIQPAFAGATGTSSLLAALRLRWPRARETSRGSPRHPELAGVAFDVVHTFRLSGLPHAFPYLFAPGARVAWHLDIDEAEAASRRALAALYYRTGRTTLAKFLELEATLTERFERDLVTRFDRVYVSSESERRALAGGEGGAAVRVLHNTLPAPPRPPDTPPRNPFRLLFVGTLAFAPNDDAVQFFCRDVLPQLRRLAPVPFVVTIVGGWASDAVRDLARLPEIEIAGAVADVAPWYARASAVIVPLRAGGGLRIKVLEAMRHGRPMVTTAAGVTGVDVGHESHVLIADDAEAFAAACARLMRDEPLAHRLAREAFALFSRCYTPQAAAQALDD